MGRGSREPTNDLSLVRSVSGQLDIWYPEVKSCLNYSFRALPLSRTTSSLVSIHHIENGQKIGCCRMSLML